MDWADQFFTLLGAWLACAVFAYVATRCGHLWLSRLSEFAMACSGAGFALALLAHAFWVRVWFDHQASIPPSVAQTLWRLLTFVSEYAPLSGAVVGAVVGCVLAYAFRRTNAA